MSAPLKIAVAGLGTVGVGVVKLLAANGKQIAERYGRPIQVVAVSARNRKRKRGIALGKYKWLDDPLQLAALPDVDVVVEVIGGEDGVALQLAEATLKAGKSFVTANKALIAHHGVKLARLAHKHGGGLRFEAAVAGGIPVIKAVSEGLGGNRIDSVYGILNGTCNYILSQMESTGRTFEDVLAEAQALGYAEADPSFDVDGVDTAHKLAILASVAFGTPLDFKGVHIEGIRSITREDMAYAAELGYRIKLLGIAENNSSVKGGGVSQRVHPCLVPLSASMAHVMDVFNAVVCDGDFVGQTMFQGRGAGEGPTASSVVADLIDIASGNLTVGSLPVSPGKPHRKSMLDHEGPYYIRVTVKDVPGVMADLASIMRDNDISIESLLQRGRTEGAAVHVVLITHTVQEANIRAALKRLGRLSWTLDLPQMLRIEPL